MHVGYGSMCYVFDFGNWTKPASEYTNSLDFWMYNIV